MPTVYHSSRLTGQPVQPKSPLARTNSSTGRNSTSQGVSSLAILGSTAPANRGTKAAIYAQRQNKRATSSYLQNDEKNYSVSSHMSEVAKRLQHTSVVAGQDEQASSKRFAASLPSRFSFVKSLNCIVNIEPLEEDELYVAPRFAGNEVLHDPYELSSVQYAYYLDDDDEEIVESEEEFPFENDENQTIEYSSSLRATGINDYMTEYYNFVSNSTTSSSTPTSVPSSPETSPRPYSSNSTRSSHTTSNRTHTTTVNTDMLVHENDRRRAVIDRRRAYNFARERDEAAGRDKKFWYTRAASRDQQNAWGLDENAISEAMAYLDQSSRRYTTTNSNHSSHYSTSGSSSASQTSRQSQNIKFSHTAPRISSQSSRQVHSQPSTPASYTSARARINKAAENAAVAAADARNARLKAQQMRARLFEHWKRSGNEDEIVPFPPRELFVRTPDEPQHIQSYSTTDSIDTLIDSSKSVSQTTQSGSYEHSSNASSRKPRLEHRKSTQISSSNNSTSGTSWKDRSQTITFPYNSLLQNSSR